MRCLRASSIGMTVGALVLLTVLWGCDSAPMGGSAGVASGRVEECPVCRANGDLACLKVHVNDTTPHAMYGGLTYWFCSEECRAEFEKHPTRYVAR